MPLALATASVAGPAAAADMPVKAVKQEQAASAWTSTADIDFRFFSWERTSGNPAGEPNQKGTQFYMPIGVSTSGQLSEAWKLDLNARGGYVNTSRSADPGDGIYRSAGVGTTTDTVTGFTITYLNMNGIVPFYSLNLNLPTGKSNLGGFQPIARTDPDLVDIPAFGVGFNHAHTLGTNVALAPNTVLTLSAGYTNRGAFDRDRGGFGLPAPGSERFSPGSNFALSAGLGTVLGALTLNGNVAASWDTPATIDGVEVMKTGFNILLTGAGSYKWSDTQTSTVNVSYAHTERNSIQGIFGPPLVPEAADSNSDIFSTNLEHRVTVSQVAQIFGRLGYLHRSANSYDPATLTFVPAKDKVSVGGGARYALNDKMLLNGRIERFWVDEKPYPANPTPEQKFEGWMVSLGTMVKF